MTLRRYVFAYDASDPMAWVRRYLATDLPVNHAAATTDIPTDDTNTRTEKRLLREAWARIYGENAASNPNAPDKWAVADADLLDADPTDSRVPARMRAFLTAPRPPSSAATFIHFADVELAMAYLQRARVLSPTFINGLGSAAAQRNAVIDLWRNLAAFFRAMNLRPWSWAKYRERFETQIGQWNGVGITHPVVGQSIRNTPRNEINPPLDANGGLPRGLFLRRPTQLNVSDYARDGSRAGSACSVSVTEPQCITGVWNGDGAGAWRDEAIRRFQANYGGDFNQNALRVRFGTRDVIADASRTENDSNGSRKDFFAACVTIDSEANATPCVGPTGDVHPVWLTNAALLGGGVNYPDDPVAAGWADRYDCAPRSLVNGMTNGPQLSTTGPTGYNWKCGAVSPPFSNVTLEMRAALLDPSGQQHARVWWQPFLPYLPPMEWYAVLVWPLVEYLASIDPMQLVYELQLDAVGKNMWTAIACGRDVSSLALVGVMDGQATIAKLRQRSSGTSLAMSGAVTIAAMVNPIAGAVAALLSGLSGLVTESAIEDPLYKLDCFGRVEPATETLAIEIAARPADAPDVASMIAVGAPPLAGVNNFAPPPAIATNGTTSPIILAPTQPSTRPPVRSAYIVSGSMLAPTSGTSTTRQIVETGDSTLRIHAMPPYGAVFIDDEDVPAIGAWEDDNAQEFWSVPIRPGPHRIRVAAPVLPDGSPSAPDRFASVVQIPKEPLTIDYATMPTAAQLANPPSQGMSGAAKAGVAVGIGAIVGLAYAFRRELGIVKRKT